MCREPIIRLKLVEDRFCFWVSESVCIDLDIQTIDNTRIKYNAFHDNKDLKHNTNLILEEWLSATKFCDIAMMGDTTGPIMRQKHIDFPRKLLKEVVDKRHHISSYTSMTHTHTHTHTQTCMSLKISNKRT